MTDRPEFDVAKSDEDWQASLTREAYRVLRRHGTEPAGTSPLNAENRPGVYLCAGCGTPLFDAAAKYDSGCGWPSFTEARRDAVGATRDTSHHMERIAVHCARCGGHLGHVFSDGPGPQGQRYCMNGVALKFIPENGNS